MYVPTSLSSVNVVYVPFCVQLKMPYYKKPTDYSVRNYHIDNYNNKNEDIIIKSGNNTFICINESNRWVMIPKGGCVKILSGLVSRNKKELNITECEYTVLTQELWEWIKIISQETDSEKELCGNFSVQVGDGLYTVMYKNNFQFSLTTEEAQAITRITIEAKIKKISFYYNPFNEDETRRVESLKELMANEDI